jgi:hypothetical protein
MIETVLYFPQISVYFQGPVRRLISKHVRFLALQLNSIYPEAGFSDRVGPLGKHFLNVTVIHIFMA